MTDAELQAALSAGSTAPSAPVAQDFNVFVSDTGVAEPSPVVAAQAPAAPVSAAPDFSAQYQQQMQMMQQLMQQNADLQNRLAQAAQQPALAPQAPAEFNLEAVLDANDREIYKDFLPLLNKVTAAQRSHLDNAYLAPMSQRIQELQQEAQEARQSAAGARDTSFAAALYSRVPDLPKVANTPEWQSYLKSQAPFSGGQTVEQRVLHAYRAGDVNTISEFYNEFATRRGAAGAPPAVAAAGAPARASVAPVAAGGAGAVAPRYISQARLDAALHAAQSGKMSRDVYEKLQEDLFSAGLEGAQLVN